MNILKSTTTQAESHWYSHEENIIILIQFHIETQICGLIIIILSIILAWSCGKWHKMRSNRLAPLKWKLSESVQSFDSFRINTSDASVSIISQCAVNGGMFRNNNCKTKPEGKRRAGRAIARRLDATIVYLTIWRVSSWEELPADRSGWRKMLEKSKTHIRLLLLDICI